MPDLYLTIKALRLAWILRLSSPEKLEINTGLFLKKTKWT